MGSGKRSSSSRQQANRVYPLLFIRVKRDFPILLVLPCCVLQTELVIPGPPRAGYAHYYFCFCLCLAVLTDRPR